VVFIYPIKKNMIKVAVLDDYQDAFLQIVNVEKYKGKFDFKIFNNPFVNEKEAAIELEGFDALFIMRERTPITKFLIKSLPKLKYIMTSGMRNKAIDLEETKKNNIIVCGTEINPNPAAEITWALILGLYRNMRQEIDNMFQGYWQTTIGFELKGKMLGLIGLGKIGTQVAKVAKAFGMEVCAWSENLNLSHANEIGVLPIGKEDLLKNSDIVSIHVVFGDRYKHLITKKEIALMKKTSFLINTSRGSIVKEDDLVEALKDEKIAGAGLDVFEKEPLSQDNKLRFLPNALILPHIGYVTAENYSKFYLQMVENLLACIDNKPIRILT
jgi:phosphoglycerate dehydrogenase-like enzyme